MFPSCTGAFVALGGRHIRSNVNSASVHLTCVSVICSWVCVCVCVCARACVYVCRLENNTKIPMRMKLFMRLDDNNSNSTINPRALHNVRTEIIETGGVSAIFDVARVKTHAHGGRQTE